MPLRSKQIMQSSALDSKSGNQKRCKSPVGSWRNSNVIQMRSRVLGYILDARQDRAAGSASGKEKYSNPSCAEIRIRIDVSSDTCLHIGNRYTVRNALDGKCAARVDGRKKIFKFFDRATRAGCDDAFVIRYLSE